MRGISTSRFARLVGCTRFQVIRIEKAGVAPQLPLALRMSKVLGVGIEALWRVPSYDEIRVADPDPMPFRDDEDEADAPEAAEARFG